MKATTMIFFDIFDILKCQSLSMSSITANSLNSAMWSFMAELLWLYRIGLKGSRRMKKYIWKINFRWTMKRWKTLNFTILKWRSLTLLNKGNSLGKLAYTFDSHAQPLYSLSQRNSIWPRWTHWLSIIRYVMSSALNKKSGLIS